MAEMTIRTGDLIDLYDRGGLVSAVVTGDEKGQLRVTTETGKQLRVPVSRVAHRIMPGSAATERAAAIAREHARAAQARMEAVDVPGLWEVLVDERASYTLGALAELALGDDAPVARSAMLRALHQDRSHFVRKGREYAPRPREHVEQAHKREAAQRARARKRAEFLRVARAALSDGRPSAPFDPGPCKAIVAGLVDLSIHGEESASRGEAMAILDEAGAPPGAAAERAFELLRRLGVFQEHENLFIHSHGLKTAFPERILEAARRDAARGVDATGRRDLRELPAFTIDDEETTELDDALSVEVLRDRVRVGVHIADPACFIPPGDPVDEEALARGATYYFPETKLPMLPPCLGEGAASLVPGEPRPALSFLVDFTPGGEPMGHEIVCSIIESRARLTYDEADALLERGRRAAERSGPPMPEEAVASTLARLEGIYRALEAERVSRGAVVMLVPEIAIRVDRAGRVTIRRIEERGPARRMVAEMMILANRLAADFCVRLDLPAIYRRQSLAEPERAAPADGRDRWDLSPGYDPVAIRQVRRRMRRGEVGLEPAPHAGLGVAAYTQVTSPIRRFQDLAMQRQIEAALRGETPPYDGASLARVAASTEESQRLAREAERGTSEYWILRYYQDRLGRRVEGVVVSAESRRTEVELVDTLYHVNLPALAGRLPGERLVFVVEAARPRARRLTLREVPA